MVFDAHERAFAFFKGACQRGIYDNMKTAVETVFVGKDRQYNRRFLQMCSHHLVEPVACTPASGWEKGQVENQVGLVRERFFTPRLRFKTYDELNAWLRRQMRRLRQGASPIPNRPEQTIWEVFEEERPKLVRLSRPLRRVPRAAGLGVEDLPGAVRQQQILGERQRGRPPGRDPRLRRPHRHPPGRARRRGAPARIRPRRDDLRSLALRAGPGAQARRAAQRRAVQGLGAAGGAGARPAQARRLRRRRPADGQDPRRGAHRRIAGGRGRLRPGARRGRPFGRRRSSTSWRASAIPDRRRRSITPDALQLRHAPVADCARYDQLRSA